MSADAYITKGKFTDKMARRRKPLWPKAWRQWTLNVRYIVGSSQAQRELERVGEGGKDEREEVGQL